MEANKIEFADGVIRKYRGYVKDVIIPGRIDRKPVVKIGIESFAHLDLTSIGECAFGGNRLTSVKIPASVTDLAQDAFDLGVEIIRM